MGDSLALILSQRTSRVRVRSLSGTEPEALVDAKGSGDVVGNIVHPRELHHLAILACKNLPTLRR